MDWTTGSSKCNIASQSIAVECLSDVADSRPATMRVASVVWRRRVLPHCNVDIVRVEVSDGATPLWDQLGHLGASRHARVRLVHGGLVWAKIICEFFC